MRRTATLRRGSALKSINRSRKRANYARSFGDEAYRVRHMACLACGAFAEAAHVTARGMGGSKGGRFDLVPLCREHHIEAGEAATSQRETFEREHNLDLRREADRIAERHDSPLGIRGLVQRWDGERYEAPGTKLLDAYERAALLGWTRRTLERLYPGRTATAEGSEPTTRETVVEIVAQRLGLHEDDAAHLCEIAGWPS